MENFVNLTSISENMEFYTLKNTIKTETDISSFICMNKNNLKLQKVEAQKKPKIIKLTKYPIYG